MSSLWYRRRRDYGGGASVVDSCASSVDSYVSGCSWPAESTLSERLSIVELTELCLLFLI